VSQSLLYHAFGVREGYEYVRTEYHHGTVEFHLAVQSQLLVCPHCQVRDVIRKGKRIRRIQTVPIGRKPVFLVTEVPRCQCRQCDAVFEVSPLLPRPMSITPNG
jgi:transposase